MKKKQLAILIMLFAFSITEGVIAQNYLGSYVIKHKKGNKRSEDSNTWKSETKRYKSNYRNLEFDLKFASNCEYILDNPGYQGYKQKLVKLCTNQNLETKNSLRVGWCYNPDIDKIELSFYAHINHRESPWGNEPGREHCLLSVSINTEEWVNVKMAISKSGMFMSVNDQSVVVSRDIYSWSPKGETTYVKAVSYFENYPENEGAVQDMDMYIRSAVADNPNFPWPNNFCLYTAENINFMNTYIDDPVQDVHVYYAGNSISCSNKSSSTPTNLPYTDPFTIIKPDKTVVFSANNSINIKGNFIAYYGSNFLAKIMTNIPPPPSIAIISEPDELLPSLNYEAISATNVYTSIYTDESLTNLVFTGQGIFENNLTSIELTNYSTLSSGHYQIVNLYVNDCYRITHNYLIIKINYPKMNVTRADSSLMLSFDSHQNNKTTLLSSNIYNDIIFSNVNEDSIADCTIDDFIVFPNPTNGIFKIYLPNGVTASFLEVVNFMGHTVYSKNITKQHLLEFDLSDYNSGIYYIKIKYGNFNNRLKIVKYLNRLSFV